MRSLRYFFENYASEYDVELTQIPNENGIGALYQSNTSEITKFHFKIPAPNAQFLSEVLGLTEERVLEIMESDKMEAVLTLRGEPRKSIICIPDVVRNMIDNLRQRQNEYTSVSVTGKSNEFNTRTFDLNARFFTYPIEIKTSHQVEGRKVAYSVYEIVEQYRQGLNDAYNENENIIMAVTNR